MVKITEQKVVDPRNLVLRFTLLMQHNQQPPVLLFSPPYTWTYIQEGGFLHSGFIQTSPGIVQTRGGRFVGSSLQQDPRQFLGYISSPELRGGQIL